MGSNATDRKDDEMILSTLNLLYQPGDVVELRMPHTGKGTVSGYFDNLQALCDVAIRASGKVPAGYVTLNPVRQDLLARSANRVKTYVKTTTSDGDILNRRWLPIDVDPVRPQGISSTDEEHDAALEVTNDIKMFLETLGVPDPISADSGNGGHLLYKVDLPNDAESRDLIRKCLEALDYLFSNEKVSVDRSVHNAARIWKLYGTLACKGDSTPERPHRLAKILEVPAQITPVTRAQLEALAAMLPETPKQERKANGSYTPLDIEAWMSGHGMSVKRQKQWQGGTVYELAECPFDSEHNNGESRILQFASGALSFGCFHNSCQAYDWHALRDRVEPGWRDKKNGFEPQKDAREIKLIRLADIAEPTNREWLLDGLIPKNYPTNCYGDGGLGKSFLALFFGTLASTGGQIFLGRHFPEEPLTALYLDWELEQIEIGKRAYQIARGLELSKPPANLLYYSPSKSLSKFLGEIPTLIESEGIQFLIIDSLGAACVDPDRVMDVVEVMTALKSFGVTTLTLDHQSKMQSNDNYDSKTPYGSVYKFNLSRSVFQLSRLSDSKNPLCLQLRHKKSNFGALADDLRFEVHFEGDRVLFAESNAPSKEEKEMRLIHEAMSGREEEGEKVNQKNLILHLKGTLGRDRIIDLLDKGKGRYWDTTPGGRTEILYKMRILEYGGYISQDSRILKNGDSDSEISIPEVIA